MQSNRIPIYYALITILFVAAAFNISCNKGDFIAANTSTNNEAGLPDGGTSYMAYYVTNSSAVSSPHYLLATNAPAFVVASSGDASSFTLSLQNAALKSDNTHTNDWLFCDATYDLKGIDQFNFSCQWTGNPLATIIAGKTYNLNQIRDNKAVPLSATNGAVTYLHSHQNLELITTFNTISGTNQPQPLNSYLIISKLENNLASGTFTLAYQCSTNDGSVYANYVKGVFNKIPVTK